MECCACVRSCERLGSDSTSTTGAFFAVGEAVRTWSTLFIVLLYNLSAPKFSVFHKRKSSRSVLFITISTFLGGLLELLTH